MLLIPCPWCGPRPDTEFLCTGEARAGEEGGIGRYVQADGLHPSAEGVALIVESLGPEVLALLADPG